MSVKILNVAPPTTDIPQVPTSALLSLHLSLNKGVQFLHLGMFAVLKLPLGSLFCQAAAEHTSPTRQLLHVLRQQGLSSFDNILTTIRKCLTLI